jgi:hypothetical protein
MVMMNRVRIMRIAVVVFSCVLLLALAGIAESYYERMQAGKLVALLSSVRVGYTTEADARKAIQPFSRFLDPHHDTNIAGNDQYDQYGFRNRAFRLLHLSPFVTVWITLDYKNGVVVEKSVQYYEEPRCSGVVTETVQQAVPENAGAESAGRDREVYLSSSVPSPVFIMKVRDNPSVPSVRRKLDWQIDLSCMTTMGGCRDPRRVLRGALLEPTS